MSYHSSKTVHTAPWRSVGVQQKAASGVFAGYASVFHVVDSQRDVVDAGAFADAVADNGASVKLLWQHDVKQPIGRVLHLKEDGLGLYVEAQLTLEVAQAREAYALLKSGAFQGMSIGFSPRKWRINPKTGVRHLQRVSLWEISLVTFPANAAAGVTVVKTRE